MDLHAFGREGITVPLLASPPDRGYPRFNLDGFLVAVDPAADGTHSRYVQTFRDGSMEAVDTMRAHPDGSKYIPSLLVERALRETVPQLLVIQQRIGVEPPVTIMVSLLGVKNWNLAARASSVGLGPFPIDRDILLLPEVLAETIPSDPDALLHTVGDALWNAAGLPRSGYYDDAGRWVGGA